MRSDMSKVVIERPRSGGACRTPNQDRRFLPRRSFRPIDVDEDYEPFEGLPHLESLRARHKRYGRWKDFTDLLGPLRRFLESRKGLKWDDVYSEIARDLNRNSVTHNHIYQHLFQFVDINTAVLADGSLSNADGRGIRSDFYVCPVTGILLKNNITSWKARRRARLSEEKKELAKTYVKIDESSRYEKIDGIWYRLDTRDIIEWDCSMHVTDKRQLSKKEIRRLGLLSTPRSRGPGFLHR